MTRRYLLVKIVTETGISRELLNEVITQSVKKCFGEIGYVQVNPQLIHFDTEKSEAIVACERDRVAELQTALALTKDKSGIPLALVTLHVSGTIKSLRQRGIKHPLRA
jgi:RNase P/RNase MRP subunit POP5